MLGAVEAIAPTSNVVRPDWIDDSGTVNALLARLRLTDLLRDANPQERFRSAVVLLGSVTDDLHKWTRHGGGEVEAVALSLLAGAWDSVHRPQFTPSGEVADVLRACDLHPWDDDPPSSSAELEDRLKRLGARSPNDRLRARLVREAAVSTLRSWKIDGAAACVSIAIRRCEPDEDCGLVPPDPEPWDAPVDGATALGELQELFRKYLVLPERAYEALALWVALTYTCDAFQLAPLLALLSPTKRCGKTTALSLLGALVRRPLATSNISSAALFRVVEKVSPTLLVDEADTFVGAAEDLRGIINSGHTRATARVIRCVGDNAEPKAFGTFGPKVLAGIGDLPGTVEDRAIVVRMARKSAREQVERLRVDRIEGDLAHLRRKLTRWAQDNLERLREFDPDMPSWMNDRQADNWRPLFAIAGAAGETWQKLAAESAARLAGRDGDESDADARALLLADLRELFDRRRVDRLASEVVVAHLAAMEDRPWPEWKQGKPITARQLAHLLQPFGARPRTLRIGSDVVKGYAREDLAEAFERYIPHLPVTRLQASATAADRDQASGYVAGYGKGVTHSETDALPAKPTDPCAV